VWLFFFFSGEEEGFAKPTFRNVGLRTDCFTVSKSHFLCFFFPSLNKKLDRYANYPAISFFPGKICLRIVCFCWGVWWRKTLWSWPQKFNAFFFLSVSLSLKGFFFFFCLIGAFGRVGVLQFIPCHQYAVASQYWFFLLV
jgi:hypothetical protein